LWAVFFLQRKVQLLSPDKQTFEVEWDVAMRSTVIKQMLEGEGFLVFLCPTRLSFDLSSGRCFSCLHVLAG
jgi:hypothetical protein